MSHGTPVLKAKGRGNLTVSIQSPGDFSPDDFPMQINVENITPSLFQLDQGQNQLITFKTLKGQPLTIPLTAQKLGQDGFRVRISDWTN
ncbi:MAG TPA: hypothetical protein PKC30_06240 [Saprospiraceae bacterium]|nr:hypothetical protein [Saprospiraceae bacterium]